MKVFSPKLVNHIQQTTENANRAAMIANDKQMVESIMELNKLKDDRLKAMAELEAEFEAFVKAISQQRIALSAEIEKLTRQRDELKQAVEQALQTLTTM